MSSGGEAGVHRIVYTGSNAAPTARITAGQTFSGPAPLNGQLQRLELQRPGRRRPHLCLGPGRQRLCDDAPACPRPPPTRRHLHRRASRSTTGTGTPDARPSRSRRGTRPRCSAPSRRAPHSRGRRGDRSAQRQPRPTSSRGRWRVGSSSWQGRDPSLPERGLPHPPPFGTFTGGGNRHPPRRHRTSTRPTCSSSSRSPTAAASPTARTIQLNPKTVDLTLRQLPRAAQV